MLFVPGSGLIFLWWILTCINLAKNHTLLNSYLCLWISRSVCSNPRLESLTCFMSVSFSWIKSKLSNLHLTTFCPKFPVNVFAGIVFLQAVLRILLVMKPGHQNQLARVNSAYHVIDMHVIPIGSLVSNITVKSRRL